jgi:hypothetical protein
MKHFIFPAVSDAFSSTALLFTVEKFSNHIVHAGFEVLF